MKFAAEYHLNVLDDEGQAKDLFFQDVDIEIHLKDGFVKTGIIDSIGRTGIYLKRPRVKGNTFYSFSNIKYVERINPWKESNR